MGVMSTPKPALEIANRNDRVWQIGNTGFRNPERLTAVTRLVARLQKPLWTPGLPPSKAFAEGKAFLAKEASAARAVDPEGERQLMRVDASMEKLDGVGKALMACLSFGLMKPLIQAYGVSGSLLFTERGKSFLSAHTDRARRVVFARALARHEVSVQGHVGRPLQRIAQVIMGLDAAGHPSHLTAAELGWCVLTASLTGPVDVVVDSIVAFRDNTARRRKERESRATCMARENAALSAIGLNLGSFKRSTLLSYADVTARHLLFTGLFVGSSPRSLVWDPRQKSIWLALAAGDNDPWATTAVESEMRAVLEGLLNESLPQYRVIVTGLERLDARETTHRMADPDTDAKIVDILSSGWSGKDIAWGDNAYPISELRAAAPAVEWALTAWVHRALTRSDIPVSGPGWRGRADVIGRPERCAPGGDADAIIETASSRYVLEATLLTHSRQEACECESVSRHVATASLTANGKKVWGLFSAPAIDYNTLATFLSGEYFIDNVCHDIRIIPLDFFQLITLQKQAIDGSVMDSLFEQIWAARPLSLPSSERPAVWSAAIAKLIADYTPASMRALVKTSH